MDVDVGFAFLLTALAGLSTGIGSAVAFIMRRPSYAFLAVALGFSAGVMIYVSFAELLVTAIEDVGFGAANLAFFIGIGFIAAVDWFVPHEYEEESLRTNRAASGAKESPGGGGRESMPGQVSPRSSVLKRAGLFTALGLAIHNFPEGLVTFTSAATGQEALGITVAIAIAVHNIPEGIVVSVPIQYATGSRRRAFIYSFVSGLAEPLGAVIGYAILWNFLTPALLSSLLAFVAGIMVYISLDELLPLAHRYGSENPVILGCGAGMLVMAVSLFALAG